MGHGLLWVMPTAVTPAMSPGCIRGRVYEAGHTGTDEMQAGNIVNRRHSLCVYYLHVHMYVYVSRYVSSPSSSSLEDHHRVVLEGEVAVLFKKLVARPGSCRAMK
jgi:hypothetical protein